MPDDVNGLTAAITATVGAVSGAAAGYGSMRQRVRNNEKRIEDLEDKLNETHDTALDRLARIETKLDGLVDSVDRNCS